MSQIEFDERDRIILGILYMIAAESLSDDGPLGVASLGDEPLEQALLIAELAAEYVVAHEIAEGGVAERRHAGFAASMAHYRERASDEVDEAIGQAVRLGDGFLAAGGSSSDSAPIEARHISP